MSELGPPERRFGLDKLEGQLGGTAKPFDPAGRRVVSKPGHGSTAKVFIGTDLSSATFKDLKLAKATFHNVSLADAQFDDIDFSNAAITANCNFRGMSIAGVPVADLFAAYEAQQQVSKKRG